jgi:hypothetical protein
MGGSRREEKRQCKKGSKMKKCGARNKKPLETTARR